MTRSPAARGGASLDGPTEWDAVRDARTSFLACLRAFNAPGRAVSPLPRAGLTGEDRLDRAAAVLLALLDPTVTFAAVGDAITSEVADAIGESTGAATVDVEQAAFVLAGPGAPAGVAECARRGTALEPHLGATVVYTACGSSPVRLEGPGLEEPLEVRVPLGAAEIASLCRANAAAPAGIDLLVVGGDALTGLPRSTRIEG